MPLPTDDENELLKLSDDEDDEDDEDENEKADNVSLEDEMGEAAPSTPSSTPTRRSGSPSRKRIKSPDVDTSRSARLERLRRYYQVSVSSPLNIPLLPAKKKEKN